MAWHLLWAILLPGCGATAAGTAPSPSCHSTSLLQVNHVTARQPLSPESHPAPESHIAQRRRLGHQLLQNQGPPGGEVEAYAQRYHRRLSQSSLILYQHVSKCAGTMLCEVGRANGCETASQNCHVDPLDAPMWLMDDAAMEAAAPEMSCQSLAASYEASRVRLEGNERFFFTGVPCQGFWNVLVMREPVKRIISHLAMFSQWYRSHPKMHFKPSPVWQHASPAGVFAQNPRIANNFFIRSVLGRSVYALPFGSIGASHLGEAAGVLERFDVLLVTEEGNRTALEEGVRMTLGFDMPPNREPQHLQRVHQDSAAYARSLNWTNSDWEELRAANALDSELWERARALHRVDDLVFRHPRFAQASAAMPRGPCGYLAK